MLPQLEKEIEDTVRHDEFISWITDRFRESKTVASIDELRGLYSIAI